MIRRFVGDSFAYGVTTILSRATMLLALLVLPFLLTTRAYGALGMIAAVGALIAIIIPLEVAQGLQHFFAESRDPGRRKAYASSAWSFHVVMVAAFLLLGQLLAEPLCRLVLGDLAFLAAFRLALVLMALNCLFLFLQNQCRFEFRTAEYVLISLVYSFMSLALSLGLGLVVDPPLVGVVLGQVVGAALAVGLAAFGLRRSFAMKLDPARLKEMLRFALPLVPASVALYLSVHAGRLILNGFTSLEDVGIYTLAVQIGGVAALGVVGIQAALTPLVMTHHAEPATPIQLARMFEAFFGLALIACLALGLFAPEAIYFLGNPEYAAAGPLVLLIAPGLLLTQMYVFAPGFAVARRTVLQMWVSIASALVAAAANFVLIPWFGVIGAAAANFLAGVAFLSIWFAFSQRLYPIPVRWRPVAFGSLGGVLLGLLGQALAYDGQLVALVTKTGIILAAAVLVVITGLVPTGAGFGVLKLLIPSRLAGLSVRGR